MHSARAHAWRRRPGFTLIEMFVVLGIILSLSVLTVLFMPRIQERQKVPRGADLLQGWLLMAKQRALRDRVPTGVRLQPISLNPNDPTHNYVRDLQYIQKPDDFSQGLVSGWQQNIVTFTGVDFLSNLQPGQKPNQGNETTSVQAGDYLLIHGGEGVPTMITAVTSSTTLQVASASQQVPAPCSYRIMRQPRLLAGEEPLQLPQDVAIDVGRSLPAPFPARQPPGSPLVYWEIVFSPSGRVVGTGAGNAPIALWVRDVTLDANAPGDQTLVVIYPRTGLIAAHPVAQGADPYQFIRDGRASGF